MSDQSKEVTVPQLELVSKRGPKVVRARAILEATLFAGAATLVMASAVSAKRAHLGPPLVALDQSRIESPAPIHTVAAAPEQGPIDVQPDLSQAAVEFVEAEEPSDIITPEPGHVRYYNGRPIRPARTIMMVVTAYSPDERSCGKWADGYTATNHSVWTNGMKLVAADKRILPMRSMITVPGYADDQVVPVLDVGGAIKGARLDVLYPTHAIAMEWGVQRLPITVWEYADED